MAGAKDIEQQAASWLLRRESDGWSSQDQVQLDAWLAASTLHRVAYLRLEAGWEEANRLRVWKSERGRPGGWIPAMPERLDETALLAQLDGTADAGRDWRSSRRRTAGVRIAATVLVMVAATVTGYQVVSNRGEAYSTPVGGSASIPLADGSKVTLNTASRIRVRLMPQERNIELVDGEAFFEVAKDPSRPFVVQAGDRRVVAVGTQFSVQRAGEDLRVVVTEGVVRLEAGEAAIVSKMESGVTPAGSTRLAAGAVAFAKDARVFVASQSVPRAEEALSWRTGFVVFHETTLADAIAEFNRYNAHEIVIADPQVAGMRLTGKFRAANFDAFVRLLEESLRLHVERIGDRTVISGHAVVVEQHR